jgi:hypothetical protein
MPGIMLAMRRVAARRRARRPWRFVAMSSLLLVVGGCGRAAPRLEAPAIDAVQAGRDALAEYDTNGDGAISGVELDQCPGLKAALKQYDKGTGKITAADITERIVKWQESRIFLSPMPIRLKLDGKPLEGASVTAEPEKFLGTGIPAATGITNSQGTAFLQVAPNRPGLFYGIYKLRVSKQIDGRETIPARYNTKTVLGFEKAPDGAGLGGGVKLDLTSN